VPNKLWRAPIYTPTMSKTGGSRLSKTVAILAKGKCFFGPSAQSLRPYRNINLSFQQINIFQVKYVNRYLRNWVTGIQEYDQDEA
jgi:hypothetical protein